MGRTEDRVEVGLGLGVGVGVEPSRPAFVAEHAAPSRHISVRVTVLGVGSGGLRSESSFSACGYS